MSDIEPTYASFGEYIRELRLTRRLTIVKAAKRMGFSQQKLCDIEQGRRYKKSVTMNLVVAVSKAYSVEVGEIVRHTNTAISHNKTVSEILDEVWPKARFAEILAESLLSESRKLAPEIEEKTIELSNSIKEIRGLLSLLRKRHYNTESEEKERVTP